MFIRSANNQKSSTKKLPPNENSPTRITKYSKELQKTVESLRVMLDPPAPQESKYSLPKHLSLTSKPKKMSALVAQEAARSVAQSSEKLKSESEVVASPLYYISTPRLMQNKNPKVIKNEKANRKKNENSKKSGIVDLKISSFEDIKRTVVRRMTTFIDLRDPLEEVEKEKIESGNLEENVKKKQFIFDIEDGRSQDSEAEDENNLISKFKELNKISQYHDKYFSIDPEQGYRDINTNTYWDSLKLSNLLRKNIDFYRYKKREKDRFTFRKAQKAFDESWLKIHEDIASAERERRDERFILSKLSTGRGAPRY